MRDPDFWWRARASAGARLLAPLGRIVGSVTAGRMARAGARAAVPVICVGNFVVGGAGKTPAVQALARMLAAAGERPFFLSRGFGGQRRPLPLVVDLARHSAVEVGDEPLLLARSFPTIVARDRAAAATLAEGLGATCVVMDDGLQSRRLEPDLAVAVVDGEAGVGNGLCLPAGPLRAPLSAQLRHVDVVIVVGPGDAGDATATLARAAGVAVLRARLVPDSAAAARLKGRRVVAFAGIGRPQKFFASLAAIGAEIVEAEAFADHYAYRAGDIARLRRRAAATGSVLATTEKDAVRLSERSGIETLPITLVLDDPDVLGQHLVAALARRRKDR